MAKASFILFSILFIMVSLNYLSMPVPARATEVKAWLTPVVLIIQVEITGMQSMVSDAISRATI